MQCIFIKHGAIYTELINDKSPHLKRLSDNQLITMAAHCFTFPSSQGKETTILTLTALVAFYSLVGGCTANKDISPTPLGWGKWLGPANWSFSGWPQPQPQPGYNSSRDCPFSQRNHTGAPTKIVVGGSNKWNFGFNYSDWAFKNAPFYLDDVLVFKYAAAVNGSPGHSVYLLPDFWSYLNCDLSRAKRVATPNQGQGKGFEFKLSKWQPHYFACGQHNGIHCKLGMMKFFVMPIFHYST